MASHPIFQMFVCWIVVFPTSWERLIFLMIGRWRFILTSCGHLTPLGLRRAEFFASAEKEPNLATLLCFRNLAGLNWDLAKDSQNWDATA